jgi:hypothetical protein
MEGGASAESGPGPSMAVSPQAPAHCAKSTRLYLEIERRFLEDCFKLQAGLAPPCDLYRFIDRVSSEYTSRNTLSSTHLVVASNPARFSSSCVLFERNTRKTAERRNKRNYGVRTYESALFCSPQRVNIYSNDGEGQHALAGRHNGTTTVCLSVSCRLSQKKKNRTPPESYWLAHTWSSTLWPAGAMEIRCQFGFGFGFRSLVSFRFNRCRFKFILFFCEKVSLSLHLRIKLVPTLYRIGFGARTITPWQSSTLPYHERPTLIFRHGQWWTKSNSTRYGDGSSVTCFNFSSPTQTTIDVVKQQRNTDRELSILSR